MQNPMNVTVEEVLKEDNILKPASYIGKFFRGDFRYMVQLRTKTAVVYFEFHEN